MSYPDSVRYLYSLGNELKAGAKFGLERMQILLSELKNPERGQGFVHVAGTNGKGSTCAMIASILQRAGLATGLYTSPHLIEPTERIQVNGSDVTSQDFAAAFGVVHEAAEELLRWGAIDAHPSYFETVTAMAFLIFHETAQISVIEVGLGGRLDATNVITPELCVITSVAYDHEAFLGSTIEAIAAEKAGILKPGVPLIVAPQERGADQVIARRAAELRCELTRVAEMDFELVKASAAGSRLRFDGVTYRCPLPGRHQIENAMTAVLACQKLGVETSVIQAGLEATRWPGRLEYIRHDPDFILDGAHNPAGAAALASYIREFCRNRPVWLVFGAMRDKAVEEVAEKLFPLADRLIATALDMPRSLRPEAILELVKHSNATAAATVDEAISRARQAPADAAVFFTGSLFLVGEARKRLLAEGSPSVS